VITLKDGCKKRGIPYSACPNPIRKAFRHNRQLDAFTVEEEGLAIRAADEHEVSTAEKGNAERIKAELLVLADLLPVYSVE